MHGRCIDRNHWQATRRLTLLGRADDRSAADKSGPRRTAALSVVADLPTAPHRSKYSQFIMADEERVEDKAAEPTAAAEAEPASAENATPEAESKKLICKHWVRPKFLQYNYLYDYRHNYYDDVINYMDKRNKGLPTEPPRAQTWAERALRTYIAKNPSFFTQRTSKDTSLLKHISIGARFHRYHSKSLISRKYSKLGFNTVSI